ncbi:MAG: hypothetical protein U1E34_10185 [Amaricoccus sp.]
MDYDAMTEDEFWALACAELRQSLDALTESLEETIETLASFERTVARLDRWL